MQNSTSLPMPHPNFKKPSKNIYLSCRKNNTAIKTCTVDGNYIRSHIDIEFTNFGHHYRYPYIPNNEFWIDQQAGRNEEKFYLRHLLIEYRLMRQGLAYAEALEIANQTERKMRRQALTKLNHLEPNHPPPQQQVHQRLWYQLNKIKVWIVDGFFVRTIFHIDFTAGGHDQVYQFIPKNEIWIDDDIIQAERPFVLLHELYERNLMLGAMDYSAAHQKASQLESYYRLHPRRLKTALQKQTN